jgi:hypothetical protein
MLFYYIYYLFVLVFVYYVFLIKDWHDVEGRLLLLLQPILRNSPVEIALLAVVHEVNVVHLWLLLHNKGLDLVESVVRAHLIGILLFLVSIVFKVVD